MHVWIRQHSGHIHPLLDATYTVKPVKRPLSKRPLIGFQDQLSLNDSQTYCRMLKVEHSAILLTGVIKIVVWSFFEWPLYTVLTLTIIIS